MEADAGVGGPPGKVALGEPGAPAAGKGPSATGAEPGAAAVAEALVAGAAVAGALAESSAAVAGCSALLAHMQQPETPVAPNRPQR